MTLSDLLTHWVGWGWLAALIVWLPGAIVILTVVQRWFMERYGTRIPTAVIFVLWSLIIMGAAGRYFGYGPPGGR